MAWPRSSFAPTRKSAVLRLPDGAPLPVTVVTLVTTDDPFNHVGELYYLQVVRQFPWLLNAALMGARCQTYLKNVDTFAAELLVAAGAQECDTMLGVPTSRNHLLRPYLEAARLLHSGINDVTTSVRRDPGAGSTSDLSFAERHALPPCGGGPGHAALVGR